MKIHQVQTYVQRSPSGYSGRTLGRWLGYSIVWFGDYVEPDVSWVGVGGLTRWGTRVALWRAHRGHLRLLRKSMGIDF